MDKTITGRAALEELFGRAYAGADIENGIGGASDLVGAKCFSDGRYADMVGGDDVKLELFGKTAKRYIDLSPRGKRSPSITPLRPSARSMPSAIASSRPPPRTKIPMPTAATGVGTSMSTSGSCATFCTPISTATSI